METKIDFEPHSGIHAWNGYSYFTINYVGNNNCDVFVFDNVVQFSDKYSNHRSKESKWECLQQ